MIKAVLVGQESVIAHLQALSPKIVLAVTREIRKWSYRLEGHIKANKLTGQVLGKYTHWKATNRLRNSVQAQPVEQTGDAVTGKVATNVEYAAFWEYGYHGPVAVKAHLRMITQAFGKSIKGGPVQVNVKAHTRQVNVEARSFMRSALADLEPQINQGLREAITKAVKS